MSVSISTCPMCGLRFDTAGQQACGACPLHRHCSLICCPGCGYTMVDTAQSWLARAWTSALAWVRRAAADTQPPTAARSTLAAVPPGGLARVAGFGGLAAGQREQLQAYGLMPGRSVRMIQRTPVVIVRIDHTEIALEYELACGVRVEAIEASSLSL
jgi:Fe2+ transport system protein FeoA